MNSSNSSNNVHDEQAVSQSLNQSFQGFHHQSWSEAIAEQNRLGNDYVIATVLGTSGSTPRASGSKMVITGEQIYDTLGGGHLEFKVIEKARQLLAQGEAVQVAEQFHLGANLGQCCGGATVIMFEVMMSQHMNLDIYGAGHVAQALVNVLAHLPIRIRWIDSRAEVFPQQLPANVTKIVDEEPVEQAKRARANTAYLILTHNHQLDFALTEAILKRDDVRWLGVIGSDTKAKRFQYRLGHRGFSEQQIASMQCPVGIDNVSGKLPMEVAVSIAGQLIGLYQQKSQEQSQQKGQQQDQQKSESKDQQTPINNKSKKRNGLQWQELTASFATSQSSAKKSNAEKSAKQNHVLTEDVQEVVNQ
ncbi:xanthine dehydrogenase accessory protein XdhC [Thalassotalea euphylliae]|uniref:Xanthine dehydrogenase accessory protein XdhC n=1 Tax=Thalassotalea euphylliae TaxID=1655234 RepID=A0A3E0U5W8_9GAMM|nr:xanthine dehydrogenase accessory protein XdhC [Thalassotalea euphylliae]REL32326.1 xanthine dehydrogenase accessory protein XdhC [Thalassotalea euphylliae]